MMWEQWQTSKDLCPYYNTTIDNIWRVCVPTNLTCANQHETFRENSLEALLKNEEA